MNLFMLEKRGISWGNKNQIIFPFQYIHLPGLQILSVLINLLYALCRVAYTWAFVATLMRLRQKCSILKMVVSNTPTILASGSFEDFSGLV